MKTYNHSKISNAFGKFYSTLGLSLANKIKSGKNNIDHYLGKIPCNLSSMVMWPTSQREIEWLVEKLPNKTSHGHDMISNVLLKNLNKSISFLLFIIFNQSMREIPWLDENCRNNTPLQRKRVWPGCKL